MLLVDGVTCRDVVEVLKAYRPIGNWRLDLKTGHLFWTPEVFEIYGMDYTHEPVNFVEMNNRFHPDDLSIRLELLERSAKFKTPFNYVLRIKSTDNDGYQFIRVAGRYRETDDGFGEFIGATTIVDDNPLPSSRVGLPELALTA
jgi:PAS domain-containing protein